MDILDRLYEYCGEDYVPMHMPGAKRNTKLFEMGNPYGLDITEITGFDNMHHADGIIKEAFERAAGVFGADETLFLVNGSSAGILSAICGATKKHDTVLVSRNCHVSVYNAMYLNELNPIYLYPKPYCDKFTDVLVKDVQQSDKEYYEQIAKSGNIYGNTYNNICSSGIYGAVAVEDIRRELDSHSEISAVIITSPTYEGVVSDIKEIADVVHKYGKVLIVDEAHGAHFNFHREFPDSAVKLGADAVIQSIHKTLPSFTQTALLHLNGDRIDKDKVKFYWNIYQSTSPSYILMGGIDRCISIIEKNGHVLFENYIKQLKQLRCRLSQLKNIYLLPVNDISKIVLVVDDGKRLQEILYNNYHIELEMSSLKYIIAMTSIGDTKEYYERFAKALEEIDKNYHMYFKVTDNRNVNMAGGWNCIDKLTDTDIVNNQYIVNNKYIDKDNNCIVNEKKESLTLNRARVRLNIYDTISSGVRKKINITDASGSIAAGMVCFYPPGIPIVNPGEEYTNDIVNNIIAGVNMGLEVMGVEKSMDKIYVDICSERI